MEQEQEKLQQAVESTISRLEKNYLRNLRKEGFLCSAKCCDTAKDHEQLQHCVNTCQEKPSQAEELLGQELHDFQQRLQRCAVQCRDSVADRIPSDQSNKELLSQLQKEVDACASKCITQHISALGPMESRISDKLKSFR